MSMVPSSSRSQAYTGYVLHKRAYRETSLLVDFFTLEQGRVSAVAKGARGNTKSERKSLLQALQKNDFELSGRSALKNLGKIEGNGSNISLTHTALYCAFYINEILTRALPEAEPMPELFAHYERTLQLLSQTHSTEVVMFEPILREFEFTLLHCMGYLPDFSSDMQSQQAINIDEYYRFDVQGGFTQCHPQTKHAISGQALIAIASGEYTSSHSVDVLKAAKYICRHALKEIIGSKPIKSRELFLASL